MAKDIVKDGELDLEAANQVLDQFAEEHRPPDAEPTAEPTKTTEPVAAEEPDTPDDAASPEEPESEGDWTQTMADEIRELVASLGLSEDELKVFSGADELQRHASLLDKQIMRLGEKFRPGQEQDAALAAQDAAGKVREQQQRAEERPRGADGRFQKQEAPEQDVPGLDVNQYDEGLADWSRQLASYFGGRIEKLEQMLEQSQERVQQAERQQQDVLIDALGQTELFGDSKTSRTTAQQENRAKLLQTTDVLRRGMASLGVDATVNHALLKRALNQEFADELAKQQRQTLTKKLQKQEQKILGGSGQRADRTGRAWTGPPEKNPELLEAFYAMEREAGHR